MADSNYNFMQPIRYYKANDPYFYEVDNLPIRQLEENILYLKEKLEGTDEGEPPEPGTPDFVEFNNRFLTGNSEISIGNIKELRPKVLAGRTVRVNSGKFVARVNDTFNIAAPLSNLLSSYTGPEGNVPVVVPTLRRIWSLDKKLEVWDEFINGMGSGGAPYNMNGLEINYTFYSTPGTMGSNWGWRDDPGGTSSQTVGDGMEHTQHWGYPFYDFPGDWWNYMTWPQVDAIKPLSPGRGSEGTAYNTDLVWSPENLVNLHLEFVKMWRAPFRTAVVDVPDSNIQIPAFSDDDFRYINQDWERTSLKDDVTHRIDLLVAYTMSVDSSSTTLNNYESTICGGSPTNPSPKTITQPVIGLVRGAGFGVSRGFGTVYPNPTSINAINECAEGGTQEGGVEVGSPKILGNSSDQDPTANYGITNKLGVKIHGSFPSPDDLLNLAPVLAFGSVAADDFQRIGQTALPIAYIVVEKDAASLTMNDIIDIRPFLRTTEFTYNERAGIAAANPALSLANPAVGAYQLQDVVNQVYNTLGNIDVGESNDSLGRVLYTDYVMGGLGFGVEGTLLTMNNNALAAADPWGSITQNSQYGGETFTSYTNSKAFLDDTSIDRRTAFISYLYNSRQSDLKKWLSDPNSTIASNGNYLNLPSLRNIPIYPEWDPPVDVLNYLEAAGGFNGGPGSPQPTWWTWFEGVDRKRPWRYVPGGVVSTDPSRSEAALDYDYANGFGNRSGHEALQYAAFTQMSSKTLDVVLPSWVNDYDILVEYMNCRPMTFAGDDGEGGDVREPSLGLQSGLSIDKGPVTLVGGEKRTTFTINSAGQSLPANNNVIADMLQYGELKINNIVCPVANTPWHFLTYSVILPQYKESGWRTGKQSDGNQSNHRRYTPKAGASYYPTVKFTIVGYSDNKITQNSTYQDNGTMLPSSSLGDETTLLDSTFPPIYDTTVVDIKDLS